MSALERREVVGRAVASAGAAQAARRAARASEAAARERARTLLPDLEAELAGEVKLVRGPSRVGKAARARFVGWARVHYPEPTCGRSDATVEAAAALGPRSETEWLLALACAGCAADGFDLAGHLRRVAAEVQRARRVS